VAARQLSGITSGRHGGGQSRKYCHPGLNYPNGLNGWTNGLAHRILHSEDSKLSHGLLLAYHSYLRARVFTDHNAALDRCHRHFVKTCGRPLLDLLAFTQNVNELCHRGQRHLGSALGIVDSGGLLLRELSWRG
jgi:hypothetical protein